MPLSSASRMVVWRWAPSRTWKLLCPYVHLTVTHSSLTMGLRTAPNTVWSDWDSALLLCSCRHMEAYDFKAVEVYWHGVRELQFCGFLLLMRWGWLAWWRLKGIGEALLEWFTPEMCCSDRGNNLLLQWEVHKVHHGQLEGDCLQALDDFSGLWKASVLN